MCCVPQRHCTDSNISPFTPSFSQKLCNARKTGLNTGNCFPSVSGSSKLAPAYLFCGHYFPKSNNMTNNKYE